MIEPQLVTALGSLVGGRVFPDVAPAGTLLPYATYQQIGGIAVNFLEGTGSKSGVRMQINIWSKTRPEAMTLIRQAEALLVSTPLFAKLEGGAQARYDEETTLRGAMQDFSFFS